MEVAALIAISASALSPQQWCEVAPEDTKVLTEAHQALDSDRPAEALGALKDRPVSDPATAWLSARALIRIGQKEEAARLLAEDRWFSGRCVPPEEDAPRQALLALVDELGLSSAPEWFSSVPSAAWLARSIELTTEPKPRLEQIERLVFEYPGPDTERWLTPRILEQLSVEALAELSLRWLDAHENQWALRLAKRGLRRSPEPPLECKLLYVQGKALRKLRKYRGARSLLTRARSVCTAASETQFAMRAGLLEAQVLGIYQKGGQRLAKVAKALQELDPEHSYLDDIDLILSTKYRGDKQHAVLAKILDNGDDQRPKAAWRLAQAHMANGRKKEALQALARVETFGKHASHDDIERARYYRARLLYPDKTERALELWKQVALRPSFYGFLSLRRIEDHDAKLAGAVRTELRATATSSVANGLSQTIAEHPSAQRARLYLHAGFPDWAASELRQLDCSLERSGPTEDLQIAELYRRTGALPDGQRLIRWRARHYLDALTPDSAAAWRLAYTQAFEKEVEAAAQKAAVDPLLLMGLAREESTFDPTIVSWAGATGLTQLMPPTAEGAHLAVFGRPLDSEALTDPTTNLRLGAHVLREGLDAFDGTEALALSAYNGGAGLTVRTLPKARVPFEDWVEANPVQENRRYVKRVLATWGIYRLLYDPRPSAGPRLPRTIGPGHRASF